MTRVVVFENVTLEILGSGQRVFRGTEPVIARYRPAAKAA
jgi:hypothetical protein